MDVLIAEKPKLGRKIARHLGIVKDHGSHTECRNKIVVVPAFGHLFELAEPEHYEPRFRNWTRENALFCPENPVLLVQDDCKQQLKIICKLLKQADRVIHAGDPDREGQVIVDDIIDHARFTGPVLRLWTSSGLDDANLAKAFNNLFDNSQKHGLTVAGRTRRQVDQAFGFSMSRALTIKGREDGALASRETFPNGRVMTPAMALVVRRDEIIKNFKPKDFFTPRILVHHPNGDFWADWVIREDFHGVDPEGYLTDQNAAQALLERAKGQAGLVVEAGYPEKRQRPPLGLDQDEIQKIASKRYGYPIADTLKLCQSLYEKDLLTYPRTDCRYLPEEQHKDAPKLLTMLANNGFPEASKADPSIKAPVWDTAKIQKGGHSHDAIIPTGEAPTGLTDREQNVYNLAVKAFIRFFYPDHVYIAQTIVVEVIQEKWKATGTRIVQEGWKQVTM